LQNYISANDLLPPCSIDNVSNGNDFMPHQNFSQHARLLPYMEQTSVYNALNFTFGARWTDGPSYGMGDPNPPDGANSGYPGQIQMTAMCAKISSLLCPSDPYPGTSGTFLVGGTSMLVGAFSYPSNFGLNRHINFGTNNWVPNGPNYIATNWDGAMKRNIALNNFLDGTSNTVMFSEWVKGPATNIQGSRDGLGMVYSLNKMSNDLATDALIAAQCASIRPISGNQNWSWKGEWWAYGGTSIYSHTIPPNRAACAYSNIGQDGRATITLVNASSLHPGGVNTCFMDGSVRFVKSSVAIPVWYAVATPDRGEVVSSDSL
jgi:prepilin-type processing-associated H-X9-DG protein